MTDEPTLPQAAQPADQGIPIVHIGDVLKTAKDDYEVLAYLGEGLTAKVFKADPKSTGRPVVLKVLRPEASALSIQNFWGEVDVIGELVQAGVTRVPRVLDQKKGAAPEFLVMEWISAKEYPGLHTLLEVQSFLPEAEALAMAEQAFELLDKLHSSVQRSYTDMQLKNFCWNSQELKVMDWNHVSYPRFVLEKGLADKDPDMLQQLRGRGARDFDDLIRLDLCRMSSYLYTMLTGKAAREQGETVWRLEHRAGAGWNVISLATRRILLRLLTPSLEMGLLKTAREVMAEIKFARELLANQDAEGLQNQFDEQMEQAERLQNQIDEQIKQAERLEKQLEEQTKQALRLLLRQRCAPVQRAECLLDRLTTLARSDANLERWCRAQNKRLEDLDAKRAPAWRTGKNFYELGEFKEVETYWPQEAQRQGKVDLWRWVLISRICADASTALDGQLNKQRRELLESGVEYLNSGRLQQAQGDFNQAGKLLEHPLLAQWGQEISALQELEELTLEQRNADPEKASQKIRQIAGQNFIKELPYKDLLVTDAVWLSRIQNLASPAELAGMADSGAPELRQILLNLADVLEKQAGNAHALSGLIAGLQEKDLKFKVFLTKLKSTLVEYPDEPEIIKTALACAGNLADRRQAYETYELLLGWSSLPASQEEEIRAAKFGIIQGWFTEVLARAEAALQSQDLNAALSELNTAQKMDELLNRSGRRDETRAERIQDVSTGIGQADEIRQKRLKEAGKYSRTLKAITNLEKLSNILNQVNNLLLNFTREDKKGAEEQLETLRPRLDSIPEEIGALENNTNLLDACKSVQWEYARLLALCKAVSPEMLSNFARAKQKFEDYKKNGYQPADLREARALLNPVIQQWHQVQKDIQK